MLRTALVLSLTLLLAACNPNTPTSGQGAEQASHSIQTREIDLGTISVEGIAAPHRGLFIAPQSEQPVPLIIISHLRVPNCSGGEFAYPCPDGTELRLDQGMSYLGEALAQAGFAVLIPDFGVIFQGVTVSEPYDQKELWRQTIEKTLAEIQKTTRLDMSRIGLFAHSRSGEMVNTAHEIFGSNLRGVLTYGAAAETYDIADISPAPADVPYLAILGDLDKDVDRAVTQWLGHWLDKPRQTPASVATVPSFGHNYANRALSEQNLDDRIGCDVLNCASAAEHERLIVNTALDWFAATLGAASTNLLISAGDTLPEKIAGIDASWLAATPKAIAQIAHDQWQAVDGSQVLHCRHVDLMNPERPADACPEPDIGVISTMTYVALFEKAAAQTNISGAKGLALHVSPWGGMSGSGTAINITLTTASGKTLTLGIDKADPALRNRATEFENGIYQLGTVRLPLPSEFVDETISHIRLETDGDKIEVRAVDFY